MVVKSKCEKCGEYFKPGDVMVYIVKEDGSLGYIHLDCGGERG